MRSFVWGAVLGFLAAALAVTVLSVRYFHRVNAPVEAALAPTRVVSVARDLPAGATLSEADLREVDHPREFIEGWAVLASDRSAVVGKRLSLPVEQGDLLRWSDFSQLPARDGVSACVRAITPNSDRETELAVEQAIARFHPAPSPLEAVEPRDPESRRPGPDGLVAVVVAGEDLREGDSIRASNLAVRRIPAELVTDSVATPDDTQRLLGSRLLVSMQAGDPVLYVFLQNPDRPWQVWSCEVEADRARDQAAPRAARAAAASFLRQRSEVR